MPTENVPTPITLAARRSAAAAIVAEVSGLGILTASLLVDIVDITTAAVLGRCRAESLGDPPCGRDAVGQPVTWSTPVRDPVSSRRRGRGLSRTSDHLLGHHFERNP
jgi:hypothetical protein